MIRRDLRLNTDRPSSLDPSAVPWLATGWRTENQICRPSLWVAPLRRPVRGCADLGQRLSCPPVTRELTSLPGRASATEHPRQSPAEPAQQMDARRCSSMNRGSSATTRCRPGARCTHTARFETRVWGCNAAKLLSVHLSGERIHLQMYGFASVVPPALWLQMPCCPPRWPNAGVRFLDLIDVASSSNWDAHGNMAPRAFARRSTTDCRLATDLSSGACSNGTLVVWTTEFGARRRSIKTSRTHAGREHHNHCFSSWDGRWWSQGGEFVLVRSRMKYGIMTAEGSGSTRIALQRPMFALCWDIDQRTSDHTIRKVATSAITERSRQCGPKNPGVRGTAYGRGAALNLLNENRLG